MTLIAAAFLMNAGCASEKSGSTGGNTVCISNCLGTNGGTTPTTPTNTNSYSSGSTVSLSTDISKLSGLFFNSIPNNPQNVQVNIDLTRTSDAIIISYQENGVTKEAAFGSNHPYASVSSSLSSGWFTHSGKPWWKGFFQDTYGAIVVVIDSTVNTGDGSPAQFVGGRIYYQNFNQYWPNNPFQGSQKMCWEITYGPYDCRTFLVGDSINMSSSQYPNNAGPIPSESGRYYQELGRFTGLSRVAAGLPDQ
jgi:hypothetical protein